MIVAVAFFFGSMSVLEGKGVGDGVEKLKKAYTGTLVRNWCVAPYPFTICRAMVLMGRVLHRRMVFVPTQIVNFGFVPHHMRVVVVGVWLGSM